ncbi:6-phosphogluconolactonase [Ketogulonicigenium vulgare]|uniref:6-phosphogluconolactonase n=1 Tax=Ketogulonicigenium vulgare (strain WSH-001) TaxID=759362 RepID=F9Y6U5_KETVW|nr:6-phosphogluconolactonase [Ketogulonicigenium vulgare]ADO42774.1 6-phosphogluconolactonase [Ketogulonicigenium vulgare Y25]AEM40962.1 6-phosphogluconolactonase [Ketogulonicigenium vulgare WSH-001]ALJ81111.1 6-phosphogluconolactonase [Ketogulonicigenium vulgare]ANW33861.1 6-phosphogluconolactonase [Ketogulonicigenium vulgare]AOZ54686.1 6-phosphogluconolactonase [Ketogulonicigenium vulgare]
MEFIEYPDSDIMMITLANQIAGELRQALTGGERASLAVPGGTTPGPVFDSLCAADLDWGRVDVMLTDERWVPEGNPRSNTRLVKSRLLTGRAHDARYIPLYAETPEPEESLDALSQGIAASLPLTVCLLGMGEDMHTASLFPGADRLAEGLSGSDILLPMRAPGAPEVRMTLTANVLNGALHRHILIIGAGKRDAYERARLLTAEHAPVAAVLRGATIHWAEK